MAIGRDGPEIEIITMGRVFSGPNNERPGPAKYLLYIKKMDKLHKWSMLGTCRNLVFTFETGTVGFGFDFYFYGTVIYRVSGGQAWSRRWATRTVAHGPCL